MSLLLKFSARGWERMIMLWRKGKGTDWGGDDDDDDDDDASNGSANSSY